MVWAKNWYTFISNFNYKILQWKGSALKGACESFPTIFVIPDLTTGPFSPSAREPIPVVIPIDLLRKRRVMMEDVNVSKARERWTTY
jgi:hypothetical protein